MRSGAAASLFVLIGILLSPFSVAAQQVPPFATANDNRTVAGRLQNGLLELHLELRETRWYPDAPQGVYEDVDAFAEEGRAPQIPGPLLRVSQGAHVRVSLHNLLPLAAKVYGLHSYPSDAKEPIQLAAGERRELEFDAGEPGTYLYWATTSNSALVDRADAEDLLEGAFVVDPPGTKANDRIFVISIWEHFGASSTDFALAVNGKSWPETERLTYKTGDTIHWRVINASNSEHAMHLHGFYYFVDGEGNGERFVEYSEAQRRQVVTEGIDPGHTFDMTWTADRGGKWLFHCHMVDHMTVSPTLHPASATEVTHEEPDRGAGMGGLVLGITILPGANAASAAVEPKNPRKLELVISENSLKIPMYQMDVIDPAIQSKPDEKKPPALVGPPLVLTRGELVEIEVKNETTHPTAIHWHGIELESYYDGVPGWTGSGQQITPAIAPGSSFVARMAPPRAGTFIYHTHSHDMSQILNGVYGALIVLEPGQKFDPESDRTFVFGAGDYKPFGHILLINGNPEPRSQRLKAGKRYRFRLINITQDGADLHVRLLNQLDGEPLQWTVVAKDGADLPPTQIVRSPANIVLTVGATCDVEVTLDKPGLPEIEASSEILLRKAVQVFVVSVAK